MAERQITVSRIFDASTEEVWHHQGLALEVALRQSGVAHEVLYLPGGEENKRLAPLEDLLEQIVGEIRDEHETEAPKENPEREENGAWVVPGDYGVDQIGNLFQNPVHIPNGWEATTVGGLVSEI